MPFLTVNVTDYRAQPMVEHSSSQESISRGKAEKSYLGENVVAVLMLICLDSEWKRFWCYISTHSFLLDTVLEAVLPGTKKNW